MNDTQKKLAIRLGMFEAAFVMEQSTPLEDRQRLAEAMLVAMAAGKFKEAVNYFAEALGGDWIQLNAVPLEERKRRIYLPMADIFDSAVPLLEKKEYFGAAQYCTAYAQYLRDLPIVTSEPETIAEATRVTKNWEETKKSFSGNDIQRVRAFIREQATKVNDLNVKTTLLLQWVNLPRDIDWDNSPPTEAATVDSNPPEDSLEDKINRLTRIILTRPRTKDTPEVRTERASAMSRLLSGTVASLIGADFLTAEQRVQDLLDDEMGPAAASVDEKQFLNLCMLSGTALYDRVTELKRSHQKMRATPADAAERRERDEKETDIDQIRKREARQSVLYQAASRHAAQYAEDIAKLRKQWVNMGFEPDEADAMIEVYQNELYKSHGRRPKEG